MTRARGCEARGDEKPLRAESSNPGPVSGQGEWQLPRGHSVATARQHGVGGSGGSRKGIGLRNPPRGGTKRTFTAGRSRGEACPVVNSQNAGDVQNDTAGLRAKGNLRGKRSDPWHRANARQSAVAVPALNGRDAETQSQACLCLVRNPVPQTLAGAGLEASLETSAVARR
jgi:hypothetical protein